MDNDNISSVTLAGPQSYATNVSPMGTETNVSSVIHAVSSHANVSGSNRTVADTNIPSASPAMQNESGGEDRVSPDLMNVSPIDETEAETCSVTDQLRQREWLTMQNLQLRAQRDAGRPDYHKQIDGLSYEELQKMYETLSDELIQKNVVYDSKQMLMQREHLRETMMALWKKDESSGDAKAKELEDLAEQMRKMNSKVCETQEERKAMQETLEALKRENFGLLIKSREVYTEIEDKRKKMEENIKALNSDEKGKKLQETLDLETAKDRIMRNVLQMLILGTGINWAQDPDLQQTLLECGQCQLK